MWTGRSDESRVLTLSPLCPGSWHHIQNLDSFFTKISFALGQAALVGAGGPFGADAVLGQEAVRAQWVVEVREVLWRKARCAPGCFLTRCHIYSYHQRNGFACILLEDVFQLG